MIAIEQFGVSGEELLHGHCQALIVTLLGPICIHVLEGPRNCFIEVVINVMPTLLGTFWYVVTAAYPAQIYPFACADRAADAGALNLLQVRFSVILDMEMTLRYLSLF